METVTAIPQPDMVDTNGYLIQNFGKNPYHTRVSNLPNLKTYSTLPTPKILCIRYIRGLINKEKKLYFQYQNYIKYKCFFFLVNVYNLSSKLLHISS